MPKNDSAIEQVRFEHRNQDCVDDLRRVHAHEVKHEHRLFMSQELQHFVDVIGLRVGVKNHDFRLHVRLRVISIENPLVVTERIVGLKRRDSLSPVLQSVD